MKIKLVIFFITLFFSSNVFSNEKINKIYEYLKSHDTISNSEYVRIGNDFYFIIDVFRDYASSCSMDLRAFDKKGWEKNRCILYRKKVLPLIEKIEFIGRKWMEPYEDYNLTNDEQMNFGIEARTTLLKRRFDYEFLFLQGPHKLYEVIK